jgi:hypothetical protein
MNIAIYIVEIFIGIFISFCGFVIWRYNKVEIISGYNASKIRDKHGLAKWEGSNLIIWGVLSILFAVTSAISDFYLNVHISIFYFLLFYTLFAIRIVIGFKKFQS